MNKSCPAVGVKVEKLLLAEEKSVHVQQKLGNTGTLGLVCQQRLSGTSDQREPQTVLPMLL